MTQREMSKEGVSADTTLGVEEIVEDDGRSAYCLGIADRDSCDGDPLVDGKEVLSEQFRGRQAQ